MELKNHVDLSTQLSVPSGLVDMRMPGTPLQRYAVCEIWIPTLAQLMCQHLLPAHPGRWESLRR
jgi:hypothetical protein